MCLSIERIIHRFYESLCNFVLTRKKHVFDLLNHVPSKKPGKKESKNQKSEIHSEEATYSTKTD